MEKRVKFIGENKIGKNVKITGDSVIENSVIGDNTEIISSHIFESEIGKNCKIGPFTHLRKGAKLADSVKVGSFVEIKNSTLSMPSEHNSFGCTEISNLAFGSSSFSNLSWIRTDNTCA